MLHTFRNNSTSKYQPSRNILYNRSGQNDDCSVFVVPRRVYFDARIHERKPRNVVLILAEVHDNAVGTVLACELNGYFSESILVIKENTDWVRSHKPGYTHSCAAFADPAFMDNSTVLYHFLEESLSNGFAQVEAWNNVVGSKRMYYYGQITKYQDCIYRHINKFEYVLLLDYDDYFNPVIANQKNIHYYVDQYFSSSDVGTVMIPWRQMECRPREEKYKTLQDGNLTSILSGYNFSKRPESKCAHRVNAVLYTSIHNSQELLSGYRRIRSSDEIAYVAHNRHNMKLCTGDT